MWKDLSLKEKRAVIKSYVANGVFDRKDIISDYDSNVEHFANSGANFVQRLKNNDRRYIVNDAGNKMTHRMSWVTEDNGAILYPEVQDNNGQLVMGDFNSAAARGDTVRVSVPFANYYSENYKKDYPEFFNAFDGPSGQTTDGTNWMQRGADSGRELGDQVAFGYFMNLEHHSANGRNLFSGKDKNQSTQQLKKVDFDEWYKVEGNRNRPINIPAMKQMQDSLVARNFGLPQRLAVLATAAQEMDRKGAASRGVGGNGYLGLSEQRMPVSYLDDTSEGRGKQIHFLLEDMLTTHPDNWLDGGSGGPTIMNGKDGFTQFWSSPNVYEATRILNKSYIRPAGRLDAWNNRASVAKAMQKHLK